MRLSSAITLFFTAICLVFAPALIALADEDIPAVGNLNLKKLKPKGFLWQVEALDMVGTGKKTIVIFGGDFDQSDDTFIIKNLKMKSLGKVLSSGDVMTGLEPDDGAVCAAFWIGDYKSGYGLFFVFYITDPNWGAAELTSAKFGADGKLTTPLKRLFKAKPPKNKQFSSLDLKAGIRDGSVGITFAGMTGDAYGNFGCQVFFVESDFQGKVQGKTRKISLPDNGNMKGVEMSTPAWNGKRWLVPFRMYRMKKSGWDATVLGDDVMLAVVTGGSGDLTTRNIASHSTYQDRFGKTEFLPWEGADTATGAPGKIDNSMYLMYGCFDEVPYTEKEIDEYKRTYRIQKFSAKGGQQGPPIVTTLPPWNRQTTYKMGNSYWTSEEVSVPIRYNDQDVVVGVTRSLTIIEGTIRSYEQETALITINRKTFAASLMARKNTRLMSQFSRPIIRMIVGKISLLITGYPKTQSWGGPINAPQWGTEPFDYFYARY